MEAPLTGFTGNVHYLEARSAAIQWASERRALVHRSVGQPSAVGKAASPFQPARDQFQTAHLVSASTK